jgi:hypothetical protein
VGGNSPIHFHVKKGKTMLKRLLLAAAVLTALAGCSSTTAYGEVGASVGRSQTSQ